MKLKPALIFIAPGFVLTLLGHYLKFNMHQMLIFF